MCRLRNRSLLHNRLTTTKPFAAKQTRAPGTYSRFQKAFILTALKDQEESVQSCQGTRSTSQYPSSLDSRAARHWLQGTATITIRALDAAYETMD